MKNESWITLLFILSMMLVFVLFRYGYLGIFGSIIILFFLAFCCYNKKIRDAKCEFPEEFEDLYQRIKSFLGKDYEKNKKSLLIFTTIFFVSLISLFGIYFHFLHSHEISMSVSNWRVWMLYGFVAVAGICLYKIIKIQLSNKKIYEIILMPAIIKSIDKNLAYEKNHQQKKEMIEQKYIISEFGKEKYDTFECEDFFAGELDGTIPFEMAELDIQKKIKNKEGKIEYETIFNGLFAVSQINKNVCEELKISPDKFRFFENYNKTVLDSSEFEKRFDVYCSDKIMAMRILSADTMEALTSFYDKYKVDFEVLIRGNDLYLRFFTGNLFEYKTLESMSNKKELFLYYSTVKFVIDLTKKINRVVNEIEM